MPIHGSFSIPRPDLADAFYQYSDADVSYAADAILPFLPVNTQAGEIEVVTRKSLLTQEDTRRAPTAKYNRIDQHLSSLNYVCHDDGLEAPVPVADGNSIQYNRELGAATHLRIKMNNAREARVANMIFDTATWTGAALATTVKTAWSNPKADVIGDVVYAAEQVRRNVGMKANALIVSGATLSNILRNDGIRLRFPGAPLITRDTLQNALAGIFGLSRIIVSDAVYDTIPEGSRSYVGGDIFSADYAMVAKLAPDGGPASVPGLGRTCLWTEDSASPLVMESYYEDDSRCMIYRARRNLVEKVFDPYFGHLLDITAGS